MTGAEVPEGYEVVKVAKFFDPILYAKAFGHKHPIVEGLQRIAEALEALNKVDPPVKGTPRWLAGRYTAHKPNRLGLQARLPFAWGFTFVNGKRRGLSLRFGPRAFYVTRLPG